MDVKYGGFKNLALVSHYSLFEIHAASGCGCEVEAEGKVVKK